MAQRLYRRDAYQTQCATVVTATRDDQGGGPAVALQATVFYPASGGQPADHGTIGGLPVIDVTEQDQEIWHHVALPDRGTAPALPPPGTAVSGTIDWPRRFDHMQQHTGQHVLSQAFLQVLRAQTVAVHMAQTCTVDLAIPEFDADGLARVERLANTVVMENRRVTTREVDADEAAGLGLRRPPKQTGLIRVVEIEGFDRSACGGTHVRATAEAGPIVVRGWEHYKGGVRAEFLCGWRALADYRQARGVVRDVTAQLTTGEADVTAALARLRERARALERDLEAARKIVLDHEAGTMIGSIPSGSGPVVACALGGRSIEDARILARAITARPGLVAVLAIEQDRRVVIARSSDVGLDAAALLRETVAPFGGRGGGRPEMAEGAAPAAPSADALVEHARAAARERLGRP